MMVLFFDKIIIMIEREVNEAAVGCASFILAVCAYDDEEDNEKNSSARRLGYVSTRNSSTTICIR